MLRSLSLIVILPFLAGANGCFQPVEPGPPDAAVAALADAATEPADAATGALHWYLTCGDPVCRGYTAPAGVRACATEKEGDPCTTDGDQCDPRSDCNARLLCAASDPKQHTGGCPISRRKLKEDIRYLSPGELTKLHDELLALPLATFRYREAPARRSQLGFILEDAPAQCLAVDGQRDQVDLYGYTSMAVAALKVQESQLEALRREVDELKAELRKRR